MDEKASGGRDIPGDLGRIVGGVGLLAIAATAALAAGHRRSMAGVDVRPSAKSLGAFLHERYKTQRRKPPEAGMPVPAIAPRGPLPMQGGAAAPLEFDS